VDYLKYDWCMAGTQQRPDGLLHHVRRPAGLGRDIVLSICEWGTSKPWLWAEKVGNLWRTTGDIYDKWDGVRDYSAGRHEHRRQERAELYPFAKPGHWNDPDMLEVGNGGMTTEEYRSHFSLWAMLAAPLIAGNDIANMDADTKSILTNKEVIAVDQDPLGQQARRVFKKGDLEVWAQAAAGRWPRGGPAQSRRRARPSPSTGRSSDYPASTKAKVRDLWAARDLGSKVGGLEAVAASHGVVMLTVQP
jgi:alpha-galactosidase